MDVPPWMEISEAEAIQLAMTRAIFPEWELQWAWNENGVKEIMRVVGRHIATGENYRPEEDDSEEVRTMARVNVENTGIQVIQELRLFAASNELFFKTGISAEGYTVQMDRLSPQSAREAATTRWPDSNRVPRFSTSTSISSTNAPAHARSTSEGFGGFCTYV
jgi:hypothetical protein